MVATEADEGIGIVEGVTGDVLSLPGWGHGGPHSTMYGNASVIITALCCTPYHYNNSVRSTSQ
jgi:hypothetical protein